MEQVMREHIVGNTMKSRWELRPKKQEVLLKVRLVLSWVMIFDLPLQRRSFLKNDPKSLLEIVAKEIVARNRC